MKCSSCESIYNNNVCPNCKTAASTHCPDCNTSFLPGDLFCRNCGKEIRFINFSTPVILKQPYDLKAEYYECDADKSARTFMSGLWPVKVAAKYGIEKFSEPTLRSQLIGSCVKVSTKQFPKINEAASVCSRILSISDCEIYISKAKTLGASVYGVGDTNYILLTSGIIEAMDYNDILFILGRQMGHVKSGHLLFLSLLNIFTSGVKSIPWVGTAIYNLLSFALINWQRSSELTADRAGLLCCQSIRTATRALTKQALGSKKLFEKTDIDEFLRQSCQLSSSSKWSEYMQAAPAVLTRIRELQSFKESHFYQRIMNNSYNPHFPEFNCYYCSESTQINDFDNPISEFKCSHCTKNLFIEKITCPHCGMICEVKDLETFSDFSCSFCSKDYFDNNEKYLPGKWNDDLPENSPYSILSVSPTANIDEISNAYAEKMKINENISLSIQDKIKYDRSYRILINSQKRTILERNINQSFYRDAANLTNNDLSTCIRCGTDIYEKYCIYCGQNKMKKQTTDEAKQKEWPPVINTLIDVLLDSKISDEEITIYENNSFYPSFKYKTANYYCTVEDNNINKPSLITNLLEKCMEISQTNIKQSLLSGKNNFLIFLDNEIDLPLMEKIWDRYENKEQEIKLVDSDVLILIQQEKDGNLKIVFSNYIFANLPDKFEDHFELVQFLLDKQQKEIS